MSSLILKSHRFASVDSIGALEQKLEGLSLNADRLAEEPEENGLRRGSSQGPGRRRAASHLGFSPLQLPCPAPSLPGSCSRPLRPSSSQRGWATPVPPSSLLSLLQVQLLKLLPVVTPRPRAVLRGKPQWLP